MEKKIDWKWILGLVIALIIAAQQYIANEKQTELIKAVKQTYVNHPNE